MAKGGPLRDLADDARLFGIQLKDNGDGTVSMDGITDTDQFSIQALLGLLQVPGSTVEGYMVYAKLPAAKVGADVPAETIKVQDRTRRYSELPGKTVIGEDTYVALTYPISSAPNGSGVGAFTGSDIAKVATDLGADNLLTARQFQKIVADNAPAVDDPAPSPPPPSPDPDPDPDPPPAAEKTPLEQLQQLAATVATSNTIDEVVTNSEIGGVYWTKITNATKYEISHRIDEGEWQPRIDCGTNNYYLPESLPAGKIEFAVAATIPGQAEPVWSKDITV